MLFRREYVFRKVNGSKMALIILARIQEQNGFLMIDCQFHTEHLESIGGRFISFEEYDRLLRDNVLGLLLVIVSF